MRLQQIIIKNEPCVDYNTNTHTHKYTHQLLYQY